MLHLLKNFEAHCKKKIKDFRINRTHVLRFGILLVAVNENSATEVTNCLEKSIIPKRMGLFQFYISDLQNYPSYPNQKEFLKSNEGNLK